MTTKPLTELREEMRAAARGNKEPAQHQYHRGAETRNSSMTQEAINSFKGQVDAMRAEPDEWRLPRFPITLGVTFHDCAGAQFWDADGNPVLVDLIPYPDLAVQLEWLFNELAKRAKLIA